MRILSARHATLLLCLSLLALACDDPSPPNTSPYAGFYDMVVENAGTPCRLPSASSVILVQHQDNYPSMRIHHDGSLYDGTVDTNGRFSFSGTVFDGKVFLLLRTVSLNFQADSFSGTMTGEERDLRGVANGQPPVTTCIDSVSIRGIGPRSNR
jgi:hypothetical protein